MLIYFYLISILEITIQSEQNITFAFGSCFKFYRNIESTTFEKIAKHNPEYFLWLGDAAYIDRMYWPNMWIPELDEKKIEMKFNATKEDPDYRKFKESHKIIGVYDDHDYNQNNGDRTHPQKALIKEKYLDFLGVEKSHPWREREGLYQKYSLDGKGFIQLMVFDVRYFMDRESEDVLGDEQWGWLESELRNRTVELFVLASGIQFFPDDRGIPESWFLKSKLRLFELLNRYEANALFLSGDIHQSEILFYPCSRERYGRTFFEYTSSGLNFANDETFLFYDFIHDFVMPPTFHVYPPFLSANYGLLVFELDQAGHFRAVNYSTYDSNSGEVVLSHRQAVSEMRLNSSAIDLSKECILDMDPAMRNRENKVNFMLRHWVLFGALLLISIASAVFWINCTVKWCKIVVSLYRDEYEL